MGHSFPEQGAISGGGGGSASTPSVINEAVFAVTQQTGLLADGSTSAVFVHAGGTMLFGALTGYRVRQTAGTTAASYNVKFISLTGGDVVAEANLVFTALGDDLSVSIAGMGPGIQFGSTGLAVRISGTDVAAVFTVAPWVSQISLVP